MTERETALLAADLQRLAGVTGLDVDPEALHRYVEEMIEAATILGEGKDVSVPVRFDPERGETA